MSGNCGRRMAKSQHVLAALGGQQHQRALRDTSLRVLGRFVVAVVVVVGPASSPAGPLSG
jgi:hypothetical protein